MDKTIQGGGRIAIYLYGHMRTYKNTYKKFLENIVNPNIKDGWKIDIFIHTWDIFSITDPNSWQDKQNLFPTLNNKKLTQTDMNEIINIYNPKKIVFEPDNGKPAQRYHKVRAVNKLRLDYEKEHNIKYDFFITTRPDIYFLKPFILNVYLKFYATHQYFKDKQLPAKFNFAGCWHFKHPQNFIVMDPRYPNESDLFWVSNYHDGTMCALTAYKHPDNPLNIFIKYRQNMEYLLFRENTKPDDYEEIVKHSLIINLENNNELETKLKLATQNLTQKTKELQTSQDTINYLNNQLNTLTVEINSYPIKKQFLEISNLEQDLINKKLKAQILEKELGLDNEINLKYNNALQENKTLKDQLSKLSQEHKSLTNQTTNQTAKSRIHNQLSYKLGKAMIENSKSLWGYIRMPYVLSYIKEQHKKEQIAYNEKIKANPNLKLPPLESYPDYKEAIKEKECLTYKLGEAMIEADKSPLKLGYITLWIKCKKIQRECRKDK
jgi:hypothetical protein